MIILDNSHTLTVVRSIACHSSSNSVIFIGRYVVKRGGPRDVIPGGAAFEARCRLLPLADFAYADVVDSNVSGVKWSLTEWYRGAKW